MDLPLFKNEKRNTTKIHACSCTYKKKTIHIPTKKTGILLSQVFFFFFTFLIISKQEKLSTQKLVVENELNMYMYKLNYIKSIHELYQ